MGNANKNEKGFFTKMKGVLMQEPEEDACKRIAAMNDDETRLGSDEDIPVSMAQPFTLMQVKFLVQLMDKATFAGPNSFEIVRGICEVLRGLYPNDDIGLPESMDIDLNNDDVNAFKDILGSSQVQGVQKMLHVSRIVKYLDSKSKG